MYETYDDKLQLYSGGKNIHLLYMVTDIFVLSLVTNDNIKDLQSRNDLFDFSNLNNCHELFSTRNEKVIG